MPSMNQPRPLRAELEEKSKRIGCPGSAVVHRYVSNRSLRGTTPYYFRGGPCKALTARDHVQNSARTSMV